MDNLKATVIGAGLYGAVIAHELAENGYKIDIYDKRQHLGGNLYDENICKINVHKYGPHIFHTSNKVVWDYVRKFGEFHNFINTPMVIADDGNMYNLPFNMNTFIRIYKKQTPEEVASEMALDILERKTSNSNLEDRAISQVGVKLYNLLIKKYTKKQWGKNPKDLPASIIGRIPIRFTFNNNYFSDKYQGIPCKGYTELISNMLSDKNITVHLGETLDTDTILKSESPIFYSGSLDELFNYRFGELEYRSLKFETEILNSENYQGVAVVNNAGDEKYTRTTEHKHFMENPPKECKTVITREYPCKWHKGLIRYYPVKTDVNKRKYAEYLKLTKNFKNLYVGGRLGTYRYMNMDQIVSEALNDIELFLNVNANKHIKNT